MALLLDPIPLNRPLACQGTYTAEEVNPAVRAGPQNGYLFRRDLTMNITAFDLAAAEMIYHHHGLEDLASSQLLFAWVQRPGRPNPFDSLCSLRRAAWLLVGDSDWGVVALAAKYFPVSHSCTAVALPI